MGIVNQFPSTKLKKVNARSLAKLQEQMELGPKHYHAHLEDEIVQQLEALEKEYSQIGIIVGRLHSFLTTHLTAGQSGCVFSRMVTHSVITASQQDGTECSSLDRFTRALLTVLPAVFNIRVRGVRGHKPYIQHIWDCISDSLVDWVESTRTRDLHEEYIDVSFDRVTSSTLGLLLAHRVFNRVDLEGAINIQSTGTPNFKKCMPDDFFSVVESNHRLKPHQIYKRALSKETTTRINDAAVFNGNLATVAERLVLLCGNLPYPGKQVTFCEALLSCAITQWEVNREQERMEEGYRDFCQTIFEELWKLLGFKVTDNQRNKEWDCVTTTFNDFYVFLDDLDCSYDFNFQLVRPQVASLVLASKVFSRHEMCFWGIPLPGREHTYCSIEALEPEL